MIFLSKGNHNSSIRIKHKGAKKKLHALRCRMRFFINLQSFIIIALRALCELKVRKHYLIATATTTSKPTTQAQYEHADFKDTCLQWDERSTT